MPEKFIHEEPVFRSTEGQDARFGGKNSNPESDIDITDMPTLENIKIESESKEGAEMVLAQVKLASSVEEMNSILHEYNKQFADTNDFGKLMVSKKIGEVKLGDKLFFIREFFGGSNGIEAVEVIPERTKEDFEKVWNQIGTDNQLRGILAHLTYDNFNKRESLNVEDIEEFYNKFPSEGEYMKNTKIGELLEQIKIQNPEPKYMEYQNKAMKFADIMFPKE